MSELVETRIGALPSEWDVAPIGELFTRRVERGVAGLPVMAITKNDGLTPRDPGERRVDTNLSPEDHLLVREGDIAYNMMRMWQGVLGRAEYDCLVSPAYVVMKPGTRIQSVFAEYLLSFPPSVARFKRLSYGVVDDRLRLYAKDLVRIPLPVPLPHEQRRIAEILSTLDEANERTEGLIGKLQQIKAGLMHDLFTRGVTPAGHLRPPRDQAPHLYKHSPLGWIPNEWEISRCDDMAELITKGESPTWQGFAYQDDGVLFVTSENVRDGFIDVSTPKYVSDQFDDKLYRSRIRSGDVLINLVGASIGRSCRVPHPFGRANINQAVCLLRAKSERLAEWIGYSLEWPLTMYRLVGEQVETARANVSLSDVRRLQLPVPLDDELERILTALKQIGQWASSETQQLSALRQQKQGLMHDLLTGRVRVPVAAASEGGSA